MNQNSRYLRRINTQM